MTTDKQAALDAFEKWVEYTKEWPHLGSDARAGVFLETHAETIRQALTAPDTQKPAGDAAQKALDYLDDMTGKRVLDIPGGRSPIMFLSKFEDVIRAALNGDCGGGDAVAVPKTLIQELWKNIQEIGYHAEMDTLKGKRRGHWIQPKAYEIINALEPYYKALTADNAKRGE